MKPADQAATTAPASGSGYLTEQGADQIAASTYIGQSVYNASDESIGEINDVIFTKDGSVEAAVIGVGGLPRYRRKECRRSTRHHHRLRKCQTPTT